jgi:hypothetical protein
MARRQPGTAETGLATDASGTGSETMMPNRRDFIGTLAAAASVAALTMPATAAALSGFPKDRGVSRAVALSIETGLPTDAAFACGAAAMETHRFLASADAYVDLLARFAACQSMPILALTSPANAILIEQALRDSGGRLLERHCLRAPAECDQLAWAYEVGGHLANGTTRDRQLSHHGHLFIAIVAYL